LGRVPRSRSSRLERPGSSLGNAEQRDLHVDEQRHQVVEPIGFSGPDPAGDYLVYRADRARENGEPRRDP
jgi:hypothetical protein